MPQKKSTAVSIQEAAERSPLLSHLADLIQQSQRCMDAVIPALPFNLRKHVSAGPIEGDTWCILAHSNAVAAKLRQLNTDLEGVLNQKAASAKYIRIRVVEKTRI
jgi:hypothetical protein